MGSELNITPKKVVECGLHEDANATAVGDSEASPESNIPADHKSSPGTGVRKELKRKPKMFPKKKQRRKGKVPAVKKAKSALAESNSDLVEFLQESQSKENDLFEHLADKEAGRS